MLSLVQTCADSRCAAQHFRRAIDDVTGALDREIARRKALRRRLARADPRVLLQAIDCFGSADAGALWLTSYEVGLAGRIPLEVSEGAGGMGAVQGLLQRLKIGMFSDSSD